MCGLERYGLDGYATIQDISEVYKTKREYKTEVMKREDGKVFTEEERDTILYVLYNRQGSEALARFIADRDLVQFRRLLPRNGEDTQSLEQYCRIFENKEASDNLSLTRAYPKIATPEQLLPYIELLDPQSDQFSMPDALRSLFPIAKNNYESQRYFHFTRPEHLFGDEGILKKGLAPQSGELNGMVDDKRKVVCISEGAEGLISMACNFSKTYDNIKRLFQGKSSAEIEAIIQERFHNEKRQASARRVAETSDFEEFIGDRLYLTFSADDIEIENESKKKSEEYRKISNGMEFADGSTSKDIPPEILKVCVLKNRQTGQYTYARDDIVKYMMSQNKVETLHQGTKDHKKRRAEYYQDRKSEIEAMADYEMEYMDLQEFYRQFQKELEKYNPNRRKRSLQQDYQDVIEDGTDLSYRLETIDQATQDIKKDIVRETTKELDNNAPNIE